MLRAREAEARSEPAVDDTPRVDALLIAVGAGIRLWQFLANRSLSVDEAALASSILHRPAAALGQALDYHQIAPLGFLWIEKIATATLGPSEQALRLFPLLAGLASLVVFRGLARRALDPRAATLGLALFAFDRWLVFYASDVKQYASDVLVAAGLLLCTLLLARERPAASTAVWLGLLGAIGGLVSHTAIFIAAGVVAAALVARTRGPRDPAAATLLLVSSVWLAGAAVAILWSWRDLGPEFRAGLPAYWVRLGGLPPSASAAAGWAPRALVGAFVFLPDAVFLPARLAAALGLLLVGAAAAGAVRLWRRSRTAAVAVTVPIAAALAAAAIGRYPFAGRLVLFLFPSFLILIGACLGPLPGRPSLSRGLVAAGCALAAVFAFRTISVLPEHFEELRPVMARIEPLAAPGDTFWIYSSAEKAFRHYAPFFGLASSRQALVCRAPHLWQHYVAAAERMQGRGRVWVILTHLPDSEATFIRKCFDTLGRKQAEIDEPGASAAVYDMGPPGSGDSQGLLEAIPPADRDGVVDPDCHLPEIPAS